MHLRRRLTAVMATVLLAGLLAMPVFAHGHHGHHRRAAVNTGCPVCTVEGCTETGRHMHDECEYCGYDHEDGYCDGTCVTVSRRGHGRYHGCYR
ncbi:MAG: hypothetical protein K1W28_14045 [Lachnospiraceae bacterium]